MVWTQRLWVKLQTLFHHNRSTQRLDDEVQFHLEQQIAENIGAGMDAREARYAAMRAFGNSTLLKEEARDTWGWTWLEQISGDIRYALRQLGRSPGFTLAVVFSLALGIGANTAIFSLIDAVMLRMLPVKNPERLVLLNWVCPKRPAAMAVQSGYIDSGETGWRSPSFAYPSFEEFRTHDQSFSDIFGFTPFSHANVNIDGQASLAEGELVTGDYFSGLGVSPILGRVITTDDEKPSAPRVAVISYSYWSRQFGGSPAVIGKHIDIKVTPFTIVGVAPPEFFGIQPGRAIDFWAPLVDNFWATNSTPDNRSPFTSRDWWWLTMMGRLKPGVTEQQADSELDVLFQESISAAPTAMAMRPETTPHIELEPASKGLTYLRAQFSQPLQILMTVVVLVLLIACANVATLLLGRSTARQKEVAVRLSLGASRPRLVRQLLTESVLLAGFGGGLGILFAGWGSRVLSLWMFGSSRWMFAGGEPVHFETQMDAKVLGFTAAVSLLTGILFGLAPALGTTRVELTPALKIGAGAVAFVTQRTRLALGKTLVVSQIALSLLLVIGAGLFVRTLQNLQNQNIGFNQHRLLLFALDPTQNGYKGQRLIDFYGSVLERLQALPGAINATASTNALLSNWQSHLPVSIEGRKADPGKDMGTDWNNVGPSFFETMGIRVVLGRGVEWRDTSNSPKVAVVNEAFAKDFLDGQNPVGYLFKFERFDEVYEIVGLVQDAKYAKLRNEVQPTVYTPFSQMPVPLGGIHFEVRAAADPLSLVPSVRRVVRDLDSNIPLSEVKTQTEQIAETLVQERLFARLSSFFGALAVLLACIGLYGLMGYIVTRQTAEIGIRRALGAERLDIFAMIMRKVLVMVVLGVCIGVPAALAATRLISSYLFGLKATDPLTIFLCSFLMLAIATLAGYLPARRAASVDPLVALRYE
ncbi:MAG TPA: ABC transporter permease [Candidatus Acidoferrum sp.]|jgi:predicted permease|nr:ABC transporter permease [Candidatus Acidoferrum sp.]